MRLSLYRHLFEYAAGRLDQARFGPVLAALYRNGARRGHLSSLAFGPDRLQGPAWAPKSRVLAASGFALLRQASAVGPLQAVLRAGRYRRGHDHPDRLAFGIHAGGDIVTGDLGTAGYALRAFTDYCRSSLAHNTTLVDEANQAPGEGATLSVDADGLGCSSSLREAFPGVTLQRRLRLDAPLVVIEDHCTADTPRRFGLLLHLNGGLVLGSGLSADASALGLPALPHDGPWAFMTNRRSYLATGPAWADVRISERLQVRVRLTADAPFELTVAATPGNPMSELRATLLARLTSAECRFRITLELYRETPQWVPSTREP